MQVTGVLSLQFKGTNADRQRRIIMAQKAAESRSPNESALNFKEAFTSFSTDDLAKAKEFYADTLSLNVTESKEGLEIRFENGQNLFIYPKKDHQPATFTVLNLQVDDIDEAVDALAAKGIVFERYTGDIRTDDKGIFRGSEKEQGPDIAWFKDPAGNIISVIKEGK
jgi:catechol 2,3-dioxygenase-like lactoylglutathione lyase family enzyme